MSIYISKNLSIEEWTNAETLKETPLLCTSLDSILYKGEWAEMIDLKTDFGCKISAFSNKCLTWHSLWWFLRMLNVI